MDETLKKIVLGGLLHDIGKFMQRATKERFSEEEKEKFCPLRWDGKFTHYHTLYTKKFILDIFGDEWFAEMTASHHLPNNYESKILQVADWLSSAERLKEDEIKKFIDILPDKEHLTEETSFPEKTPFLSVFSLLDDSLPPSYFKIGEDIIINEKDKFQLNNFEALEKVLAKPNRGIYEEIWDKFYRVALTIKEVKNDYILWDIPTWYYLLKRFTSFIPSATPFDIDHLYLPDISLFNHSRITAAIAGGLYVEKIAEEDLDSIIYEVRDYYNNLNNNGFDKYESLKNNHFILLVGDISGIQKFIYRVTSKGAAKGLRGRSVYLQFLTKAVINYILNELNLPITQIIYYGGGRFYLLLPETDRRNGEQDIEKSLSKIELDVEEKMFNIHKGDIDIILGWKKFSLSKLLGEEFSKEWEMVNEEVNRKKGKKFKAFIKENYEKFFEPIGKGGMIKLCEICKMEMEEAEGKEGKCEWCKSFEKLGDRIVWKNYFLEGGSKPSDSKLPVWSEKLYREFSVYYRFVEEIEKSNEGDIYYGIFPESSVLQKIYDMRNIALGNIGFGYELIGKYAPLKSQELKIIKSFEDFAEASEGIKRLGILRMDVDNLGIVFKEKLRNRATISRVSQLSWSLERFFKLWVPAYIQSKQEYKDGIYLIYAGGDDLFLVGRWDKVIDITGEIREQFKKYTGDTLTISADVTLIPQKFPLYKGAEISGESLESSKRFKMNHREKNALSFLGFTFGWEDYPEIKKWKDTLYNLIKNGKNGEKLPKSVITKIEKAYLLREKGKKELEKLRKGGGTKEEIQEMVNYQQWRWRLIYSLRRYKKFKEEMDEFIRFATDERYAHLSVLPARWVELLTRE